MVKNTKSVKNKNSKIYLLIATLFLIIAIVFGVFYLIPCRDYTKFTISDKEGKEKVQLKLEIADTNEKRLNGLMGREGLDKNTGMIFDFEDPGYYSMWMKDTLISLDMVFLNNKGEVIALTSDRLPLSEELINPCSVEFEKVFRKNKNIDVNSFFEKCETKFLSPEYLTRYVIELPAGTIQESGIMLGDILIQK